MKKPECNENVAISDIGRQFTEYVVFSGMHHQQNVGRLSTFKQMSTPSQIKT